MLYSTGCRTQSKTEIILVPFSDKEKSFHLTILPRPLQAAVYLPLFHTAHTLFSIPDIYAYEKVSDCWAHCLSICNWCLLRARKSGSSYVSPGQYRTFLRQKAAGWLGETFPVKYHTKTSRICHISSPDTERRKWVNKISLSSALDLGVWMGQSRTGKPSALPLTIQSCSLSIVRYFSVGSPDTKQSKLT